MESQNTASIQPFKCLVLLIRRKYLLFRTALLFQLRLTSGWRLVRWEGSRAGFLCTAWCFHTSSPRLVQKDLWSLQDGWPGKEPKGNMEQETSSLELPCTLELGIYLKRTIYILRFLTLFSLSLRPMDLWASLTCSSHDGANACLVICDSFMAAATVCWRSLSPGCPLGRF